MMLRWMRAFLLAMIFGAAISVAARAPLPAPPMLQMWRLDCGLFDIDDLEGKGRVLMPVSCYLIRHSDQYVLFDAGLEAGFAAKPQRQNGQTLSLKRTIADQLKQIGVDPAKVGTLIVSHYHGDHHGQVETLPNARLLIGKGDAEALRGEDDKGALKSWLEGQRPVDEISADRDLFGDGRVVVLHTPGHTPGHLSLLVRLSSKAFILTGDLVHSRDQLANRKPSGNHVDKVRGKAEIERLIALAEKEKATIIVGHDQDDVALLPTFPMPAE
jgi:glyoxylase-like metal-dependent hydrolase (beta-lactamase superfamily II)